MSYEDVSQCASGANFFECPSDAKFLGCCIDDDKDSVCRNGCPVDALQPAYFEPEHYDSLVTSYTQGQCDREYKWNICNSPSNEGWSFYGCYLLEGDPCGIFNLLELGNATTPADSTDSGAIASTSSSAAFSSTQPSQSVSANTTKSVSPVFRTAEVFAANLSSDPPSLPTDFPLNDVPTWGASPAPSAPSTAVIAGGTIGGVAALAAIAALIGFLIVYLRRHRGRPEPDKQLSDDAALEATVQNGLVEEKPPRGKQPIDNSGQGVSSSKLSLQNLQNWPPRPTRPLTRMTFQTLPTDQQHRSQSHIHLSLTTIPSAKSAPPTCHVPSQRWPPWTRLITQFKMLMRLN